MINKYSIIWSPNSKEDLNKIYDYIAFYLNEKTIARKTINAIINRISNLDHFPERYPRIFNYKDVFRTTRKLIVKNFIILYEVDKQFKQVYILHIFHGSQNYLNLL